MTSGIFVHKNNAEGPLNENATVLVVDDEKVILNLAKNILIRNGFQVMMTKSGEEACRILESNNVQIDLFILDMVMPGMNGMDTYKRLYEINPQVRVVFSTGYSKEDPRMEVAQGRNVGYVQKPYDVDMLVSEIRRVLML